MSFTQIAFKNPIFMLKTSFKPNFIDKITSYLLMPVLKLLNNFLGR